MHSPQAAIFGLAGAELTASERDFFKVYNPLGFILFARNCISPDQLKRLTGDLKSLLKRDDVLILIDQEGGRVARLRAPHWRDAPAAGKLAASAAKNMNEAKKAVYLNARLIAAELFDLGINVDCAPLADVPASYCHNIIGDRAYGDDPETVSILAREMARGLLDGAVLPVLKHIPGHGRAKVDSHEELPVVDASLAELEKTDFIPFRKLRDLPLGMTAHVLYTALDAKHVATLSPNVINLIRNDIGFDGLLMSDDVSMKALKGDMGELTHNILTAGCDVVLHCNGKMEEMGPIAQATPRLSKEGQRRFANAIKKINPPATLDLKEARAFVDDYLAAAYA